MLLKAVTELKADRAKTLDLINKGEGGFLDRDLYVFCSNAGDGKVVAIGNPNAKQVLGVDARTIKDANGKPYDKNFTRHIRSQMVKSLKSPTSGPDPVPTKQ